MPITSRTGEYEELLTSCGKGEETVAVEVAGAPRLVSRLQELGVLPGAQIRVLQAGSPTVIQVGRTRLGLRRQEAAAIRVCSRPGLAEQG